MRSTFLTTGFLLSTILGSWPTPTDHQPWRLLREEDVIKLFIKDTPSGFARLRIELTVLGTVGQLKDILNDVEAYATWVYRCTSATRLSPQEGQPLKYRVVTDFPFPFRNRGVTITSRQWTEDGTFYSKSSAAPVPSRSTGNVTITHFESSWIVKEGVDGLLNITYEISIEPGGEIPAWLYNLAVDQGPLQTMKNLKQRIEATDFARDNRQ